LVQTLWSPVVVCPPRNHYLTLSRKIKEVLLLLSEAAGGGIPVRGRTAVRLISLATAAAGRARAGTAHISGARHSPLAVAVQCYMLRVYVSRLRVCGSHFRFLNDELPRL
jgi:hypothetical protein